MKLSTKPRPRWLVHVYTPAGKDFAKIEARSRNAQAAIHFAKQRVYKMGKLAHFYSYVPVDRENQSHGGA